MRNNRNDFLNQIGSKDYVLFDESNLSFIEKKGLELRQKFIDLINERGVSASGKLIDSIGQPELNVSGNGLTMTIDMADYYDYTNKGVRGIKSSNNAPGSPYQFKKLGISDEGRKSITAWVQSGKAKTATFGTKTYGAQEKKQIKIQDKVEGIIRGIKKFGIKKRSWFDDAVKEVFGDFEEVMSEQIGRQISVTIKL